MVDDGNPTNSFLKPANPFAPLPDLADLPWAAQWIWAADEGADRVPPDRVPQDRPGTWVCFRHRFDLAAAALDGPAGTAHARIAVDSRYWLWINGALVVREGGLKRGPAPGATWFDCLDVRRFLRPGVNSIAVLAWYWGRHGFSHASSGMPGFLGEIRVGQGGGATVIATDGSWRARRHAAFGTTAPPHPNYRLSEANVHYDARAVDGDDLGSWNAADFSPLDAAPDPAWPTAHAHGRPPQSPWGLLFQRPIPAFVDGDLVPYANAVDLPTAGGAPVICRLPHAAQMTAALDITAPAGAVIDIRTDEYCGGGAGQDHNVRAVYVTRAGRQRFETAGWLYGNAVRYDLPVGVVIHALTWRPTGYDCALLPTLVSDDEFLTRYLAKAQRTLYVNMRDTWMDCPDRERAQWWGDVVVDMGQAFWLLDRRADLLTRKAILDLVRWQRADGVLYSPVPQGRWGLELPAQILATIGRYGFAAWWLHTGDLDTLRTAYPAVQRYLELWRLDNHLVVHRSGDWDWPDWGDEADRDLVDQGWFALAMDGAAAIADALGHAADALAYRARRDRVAAAVGYSCWAGDHYRSASHRAPPDDRAHALLVIAGMVPANREDAVAAILESRHQASPYMEKFVIEALFRLGRPQAALARMRKRFAPMVDDPGTTLWEFWTLAPWGTRNHAWAGGAAICLYEDLAGIAPTAPGWRRFRVMPQPGDLKHLAVSVPTTAGTVAMDFRVHAGGGTLTVVIPVNCAADVGVPCAAGVPAVVRLGAGGPVLFQEGPSGPGPSGPGPSGPGPSGPGPVAAQPPGTIASAGPRLLGRDPRHLCFQVPAGTWTLAWELAAKPA